MKWYKFGFTRLWDNLTLEIRNKRISRDKAISIVKKNGNQVPRMEIKKFCEYLNISNKKFSQIVNKFRDKKIWSRVKNKWVIKNFLIENWEWKNNEIKD